MFVSLSPPRSPKAKLFAVFISIYVFLRRSRKKSKYRWFTVEGFGGGVVGRWWWWRLVVSQRVSCVKLRKTFRNHVKEAAGGSSAAKLFALKISFNCARLFNTAGSSTVSKFNSDRVRIERKTVVKGLTLQK